MGSSRTEPASLYDDLAENYHLLFEDWEQSIARQATILGRIIESAAGPGPLSILDCACGIGTQAIGLARRGHAVTGSDASAGAVARAKREAAMRGLRIDFLVADMRELAGIADGGFDAAIAADNALPHLLKQAELVRALERIGSKLREGGVFLATVRDYDQLLESRPVCQAPQFYSHEGFRRFVHQVWDWEGDEYSFHLYLTLETETGWAVHHYASRYRALRRAELATALEDAGFREIRWLEPNDTSFYQPMVIARKPS